MAQHFLLTAAARTLSLKAIFRMSDDEAHETFTAIRFADNGGEVFCPRCQCTAIYTYAARRIWKCKACSHQFSVTSGTIFASRKLAIRDYLAATAIFVNAVSSDIRNPSRGDTENPASSATVTPRRMPVRVLP